MPSDSDLLNYIFLGFFALLFAMIFFNVLGDRRTRRKRRPFQRGDTGDSSSGADSGPIVQWRGRRHDSDGGSDGTDGDGSGGGDGGGD